MAFFQDSGTARLQFAENRSHSSCECCPKLLQTRPHYTCHYSRRVNCPAKTDHQLPSEPMRFVFALRTSNHRERRAGWTVNRGAPLPETCARKQPDTRPSRKPLSAAPGPQSLGPTRICLNQVKCCCSSSALYLSACGLSLLNPLSQHHIAICKL